MQKSWLVIFVNAFVIFFKQNDAELCESFAQTQFLDTEIQESGQKSPSRKCCLLFCLTKMESFLFHQIDNCWSSRKTNVSSKHNSYFLFPEHVCLFSFLPNLSLLGILCARPRCLCADRNVVLDFCVMCGALLPTLTDPKAIKDDYINRCIRNR